MSFDQVDTTDPLPVSMKTSTITPGWKSGSVVGILHSVALPQSQNENGIPPVAKELASVFQTGENSVDRRIATA